jgi:5-methyltetrahydrofolate--homocysteine methyltransferase
MTSIPAASAERIHTLDGAMASLIPGYQLAQAGYRGARFADCAHPVTRNNDLLNSTRPDIIHESHEQY